MKPKNKTCANPRRNPLWYLTLIIWFLWIFFPSFFEIALAVSVIYFLIVYSYKLQKKEEKADET